jgi:DNA polymerase I-like protein with 3'-5' exonuclease and polymerase domains
MPVITLEDAQKMPPGQQREWAYNALDTTGTREIADVLLPRLSPAQARTYAFERAMQAPFLGMMFNGIAVDLALRAKLVAALKRELESDIKKIDKMEAISSVWDLKEKETGFCKVEPTKHHKWPRGVDDNDPHKKCERCGTPRLRSKPFNANSSKHVDHLMYELLKVPVYTNKKGKRSTEGDILERIGNRYAEYQPITDAIGEVKDKKKQLGSLNARLSKSGRYPSSINVGTAWTGRASASKNPYGEGGNIQNIAPRHRGTLIADPGETIVYADLKQAESNVVAHVARDEKYIEAHLSGDVHTYVARLVWPELPWNGDLKKDKAIAKRLPEWDNVEGHDFRFQAKRIQHGSNFGLTPPGIAMIARIPRKQAETAQGNYFNEFPGIRGWQSEIREKVRNHEPLVNVMGREITLMGRPWDEHTIKQGYSFIPQSSVADILNLAIWRVWNELDLPSITRVRMQGQIHDALLASVPDAKIDIVKRIRELMLIPVPVHGRTMIIEAEIAIGKNWGKKSDTNPHGMWEPPEYNN